MYVEKESNRHSANIGIWEAQYMMALFIREKNTAKTRESVLYCHSKNIPALSTLKQHCLLLCSWKFKFFKGISLILINFLAGLHLFWIF